MIRILSLFIYVFSLTIIGHGQVVNSVDISVIDGQPASNLVLVGRMHSIRWNNSGYSANSNVQIGIRDIRFDPNGGIPSGEETIVGQMKNTGEISWLVPSRLGEMKWNGGKVYKIIVYIIDGQKREFIESHLFRLAN